MLNDFQLAALVKERNQLRLLQIPLHQQLQNLLANVWAEQFHSFTQDAEQIPFEPGYQPEAHERFYLMGYELPEFLASESGQTVATLPSISGGDELLNLVVSIVAFGVDDNDQKLVLFQDFNRAHVIRPGHFLFLQRGTYTTVDQPILTMSVKLAAAYFPADQKLLFANFRTVNRFLPLADFYEEASEKDIRIVLGHDLLAPENIDSLAVDASEWFRKRFAMLGKSGVLDEFTADEIAAHSVGFDVDVVVDQKKIVFPEEKNKAKRLLQFLNEELFHGAITSTLYQTNSKRQAD